MDSGRFRFVMATLYSNVHRYATCGKLVTDFINVRHRN
jgi:hypothetical protein